MTNLVGHGRFARNETRPAPRLDIIAPRYVAGSHTADGSSAQGGHRRRVRGLASCRRGRDAPAVTTAIHRGLIRFGCAWRKHDGVAQDRHGPTAQGALDARVRASTRPGCSHRVSGASSSFRARVVYSDTAVKRHPHGVAPVSVMATDEADHVALLGSSGGELPSVMVSGYPSTVRGERLWRSSAAMSQGGCCAVEEAVVNWPPSGCTGRYAVTQFARTCTSVKIAELGPALSDNWTFAERRASRRRSMAVEASGRWPR